MRNAVWAALVGIGFMAAGPTGGAHAATLKPVYSFCPDLEACADGNAPTTVTVDASGNLFGTTLAGGAGDQGAVFELTPDAARTNWTYRLLYSFCPGGFPCADGREPGGSLVLGSDGTIYGTTTAGGNSVNSGVVFALKPNDAHTQYAYSVVYTFCTGTRCTDGSEPSGGLIFPGAQAGAIYDKKAKTPLYGLTAAGGANNEGVAYSLTPAHKGKWTEKVIHDFCSTTCTDGEIPQGQLTFTSPNTLAGVTFSGGTTFGGTVFQLTSNAKGSKWKAKGLFEFDGHSPSQTGDGATDGVIQGADGTLYGTTSNGSPELKGVIYKLVPQGKTYTQTVLYAFCQLNSPFCTDGAQPGGLVPAMDASGNLYGTARTGGGHNDQFNNFGAGVIWKFDGTNYSVVHAFCSQTNCTDGDTPVGVVMDGSGNLFGVTNQGGTNNRGLVYEFTP